MTSSEPAVHKPLNTVLVPTDFSKGADLARERALRLPLTRAKITTAAKQMLEQIVSRARRVDRDLQFTSELLSGASFIEIMRCSRASDAELIVVGRHGPRPFRDMFIGTNPWAVGHALLGSVAESVIAATPSDVLVARPVPFSFELP